jgi:hypothetical protein
MCTREPSLDVEPIVCLAEYGEFLVGRSPRSLIDINARKAAAGLLWATPRCP